MINKILAKPFITKITCKEAWRMLSVVYPPRILMEYLLQPQNHAEYYRDKQTSLSESLADFLCKNEELSQFSEKPVGKEQLLEEGILPGVRRRRFRERGHCLVHSSWHWEDCALASTLPFSPIHWSHSMSLDAVLPAPIHKIVAKSPKAVVIFRISSAMSKDFHQFLIACWTLPCVCSTISLRGHELL